MSETISAPAIPLPESRSHAHEGLMAGALGATVVWVWLLASDWLNGSPWHILTMFGRGILDLVGAGNSASWVAVAIFTVVHFAYWCLIAAIILKFVYAAAKNPSVLGLAATIFILSQFLFAGLTAIFSDAGLGIFAWPSIWLGNFAGFTAAWWLIVQRHPELREEARHMNDDM
ncbi:MAG: hypothetical protein ABI311_08365 [Gemmatimonadaceae bacterium]